MALSLLSGMEKSGLTQFQAIKAEKKTKWSHSCIVFQVDFELQPKKDKRNSILKIRRSDNQGRIKHHSNGNTLDVIFHLMMAMCSLDLGEIVYSVAGYATPSATEVGSTVDLQVIESCSSSLGF